MDVARAHGGKGVVGERRAEGGRRRAENLGRTWLGLEPGQSWADAEVQEAGVYEGPGGMEGGAEDRRRGGNGGRRSYRDALEGGQAGSTKKEEAGKGNQRREENEEERRPKGGGKGEHEGVAKHSGKNEGKGVGRIEFSEDEDEEEGRDGGEGAQARAQGQRVEPFEQPPLPRKWLVGRLAALGKGGGQLPPEDPRASIATQRLERTRGEVRVAGGRTSKRLFFSLAGGVDRIKKAEKEVEEAEARLERAQQVVADAETDVAICRAQLEKERAVQAHKGV